MKTAPSEISFLIAAFVVAAGLVATPAIEPGGLDEAAAWADAAPATDAPAADAPAAPLTPVLLLLLAAALCEIYRLRRTRRRVLAGLVAEGPRPLPSRRQSHNESGLFDRRLGYIERVLYTPLEVAARIQDPIWAGRLRSGRVRLNTHIFACAAALEEALEGKTFENRPSNTYAAYLKPRFTHRGWAWPLGTEAWQAHFEGRR